MQTSPLTLTSELLQQEYKSDQKPEQQVLVFRVGEHQFGFNVLELDCVCRPLATAPVLKSALFFDGMLRLKGILIPVINLAQLFYGVQHQYDSDTRFVTVKQQGAGLCFVVDQVLGFFRVDLQSKQTPPSMIGNEYIDCVYQIATGPLLMINKDKLIDPAEIEQIAQSNRPSLFEVSGDSNEVE